MTGLICLLFGHRFGEWEHVSDSSCVQVRVCKRDGQIERRSAPHRFGEWSYVADNTCEQVAVCERCGYEARKTAHPFGEWRYVSDRSCEQVATCDRCGHIRRRQAPHQYQTDAYQSYPYQSSGLVEASRCVRCGAIACSVCGGELKPDEMKLDREPPWGVLRMFKCSACGAQVYTHSTEW
jgi:hypothetical protein